MNFDTNGPYSIIRNAVKLKPFGVIKPADYPLLVTFNNIADPKTVTEVDPANLAATFGAGYSLARITLQVVDKNVPVTTGIEEVLPWFDEYRGRRLDGSAINAGKAELTDPIAKRLNVGPFQFKGPTIPRAKE